MGQNINGGSILARLLLEDKKFHLGLKKGVIAGLAFSKKVGSAFSAIGSKIDAVGGRMVEQAERYTYLAGAIFAPIVLSMKSFADGGKVATERIKELQEQYSQLKPFEWTKKAQIEQELLRLSQIEMQTRQARVAQNQLVTSFKSLNYSIGKLLWGTLGEYVPKIVESVKLSIVWIQANKELASKVVKVVAGFGALMLVLAPTVAIVGKVIRVFAFGFQIISMLVTVVGALAIPLAALIVVLGGLYLLFKDQLNPIIGEHLKQLKEIWGQWMAGEITLKEATVSMLKIVGSFFVDLKDMFNESVINFFQYFSWEDTLTGVLNVLNAFGWGIKKVWEGILFALNVFWEGIKKVWEGIVFVFDFSASKIIDALNGFKGKIKGLWKDIVSPFEWALGAISSVMNSFNSIFDDAVVHSWWPESMALMSNYSRQYMSQTALTFASGAATIQRSMSAIQSSMSQKIQARGIFGMSFDQARGALATGAASNTFNISGGLSTQEFQSQIKRYVENASRQQYRRMLRS